jgi:hypothetical protein
MAAPYGSARFVPEMAYNEVVRPAGGPDGTLALVTLGSFFGWSSAYLIRCESHCV